MAKPKTKTPPLPATGDVLISGGIDGTDNATATAEFYSVKKHKFFATGSMTTARAGHQLDWFQASSERTTNSGIALGGFTGSATVSAAAITLNIATLNSIDVYDLATGTFSADSAGTNTMQSPRAFFSSIALPGDSILSTDPSLGGHVIALAGLCDASALEDCRSADIIHPSDDHTSATSNPKVGVWFNTLTYLKASQTVLMAGGFDDLVGGTSDSAEIYSPGASETFALTPTTMANERAGHTATELQDGSVLIVGGFENSGGTLTATNTSEIYDPVHQTFTVGPTMNAARFGHTATLLSNGAVLIAGGLSGSATLAVSSTTGGESVAFSNLTGSTLDTAEIYNPSTNTFSCVGGVVKKTGACKPSMKSSRFLQTATALDNGTVLMVGGFGAAKNGSIGVVDTAEIFRNKRFANAGKPVSARALASSTKIMP
ncbi:MAG TPA: kelch repeat-containing protein [Candidatus Binataceae bacterium]|nr:kelch repeat-containing protein [Candidatus Binataceae bacterium]